MIKTKDGYGKLIGTTYQGSSNQVLLSNGGNLEYSSSNKANTLVQRNSNQQVYASYFNSAISDESLTDIGSVYVRNTSDTFIRRVSKSQFYSIINEKFVTIDTIQTITGNKTFTTQINSSLSTNTHLEGNKGKTIINSIASAGSYVMLFKGNSTNGYFTHGVYQDKYLLQYTAKTTVDENTNEVTKSATLLDESGNSSFPGNLIVSGTVSGNILESRVATGTKPLNITSTTLVNNLNVDFLRGYIPIGVSGNVIRKRGFSVGSTTPTWCRMAKYTVSYSEVLTDVAFLLHSSYSGRYSILHITSRGGSYVKALLYNSYGMDKSKIRIYHDSGKNNIEFYYYAGESYSVIIAELLYSTGRTGSWDNNVIMYEGDTSSPSYSNYIVPELPTLQNNAETATKLLNPRYLWGQQFDGTKDVSGDMYGVGWINNSIKVEGGYDNSHIYGSGHGITFGGLPGYAHCYYNFRPMYGSSGSTITEVYIQNAAASNTPTFTTTHSFNGSGIGYHKRALGVGKEAPADGYNGGIYANTVLVNDWFRSEGNSGWYNQTYGGGIYMRDSTWVRTYNGKNFRSDGTIEAGAWFSAGVGVNVFNPVGNSWNNGQGAFQVAIPDNNNQTPLLLAYRHATNASGANRLFALELLNSGGQLAFGMGGIHVATLNSQSELAASLFIGNLNGIASFASILNLKGEEGSSTGTSLPANVGMQLFQYYNGSNGPTIYGNFLRIRGSNNGCGELFLGWQGNNDTGGIWYKSKRDMGSWGAWRQVVFTDMDVSHATSAQHLVTDYIGGRQYNPQTYFSGNVGLKVAMTGAGGISSWWSDTLWIKGYNGGDVKGVCSLHFSKEAPRFSISYQNFDSSSYGTPYEVLTTYNFGWASPIKWAVYLFEISSTRQVYTKYAGNTDFVSSKYSGTSTSITVYINSSYPVDETMIIGVGNSNYNVANNPMYACIRKDIAGKRITVIGGDDSSLNEGTIYVYFLYFG